jgi:predicted phosphoribosyltransferase
MIFRDRKEAGAYLAAALQGYKTEHPVAQVYANWYDVSDEEVLGIMLKWDAWKRTHGR